MRRLNLALVFFVDFMLNVFLLTKAPQRSIAFGDYWKYSTGQKNGVDSFGHNSAESERFG